MLCLVDEKKKKSGGERDAVDWYWLTPSCFIRTLRQGSKRDFSTPISRHTHAKLYWLPFINLLWLSSNDAPSSTPLHSTLASALHTVNGHLGPQVFKGEINCFSLCLLMSGVVLIVSGQWLVCAWWGWSRSKGKNVIHNWKPRCVPHSPPSTQLASVSNSRSFEASASLYSVMEMLMTHMKRE